MMRRRTRLLLVLASLFALFITLYFLLVSDLPAPDTLITRSSPDATKIYDRRGRLLYEILDPRAGRRTRVRLHELPLHFRHAVIAVEDSSFYENPGVDAVGIARAAGQNLLAGEIVAGGSTITQQLARDLLLSREERDARSYLRKLREAILSLQLTQVYSKDQILEMYVNEQYFGNLAYGVEAAARTYFGKPARDLDLAESAMLAGMIQSPAAYDPYVHLDAARARQRIVLGLMVKKGFLDSAEAELAHNESLHLASMSPQTVIRAPHFVAYVRNLLEARFGPEIVNRGGLRVTTSLDLDLQERAEAIVRHQLDDLQRRTRENGAPDYNVHDAAVVVIDPATGEILAMLGSADYFEESIQGAVNVALSNRQPGSAIKPITYAAAFARDLTPASVLSDVPTSFLTKENLPYEPQNYDRAWRGPISLREALATSNNMIAVKVLDHVGLETMIKTAQSLGISTFQESERFGLALTLGGGEVQLLELTAAYAAFATDGRRVEPLAILSIDGESQIRTTRHTSLVSPQVAYLVTNVLSDKLARLAAFGEDSVLDLSRPAAAKTGTTTDFKDNWTIGYTPDLAIGVWVGNADNEPMYKISGITGAGPIWHDLMEEALRGRPVREFARPEGLVDVEVCETSGLLPTDYCPRRRQEIFIAGTDPTQPDNSYRPFAVDAATGLAWSGGCRGPRLEHIFRILPPDAVEWGRKQNIPAPPETDCLGRAVATPAAGENKIISARQAPLVVNSPAPNSSFALAPQIPAEFQSIELSAQLNAPVNLTGITLLLDGKPVAEFSRPPFRMLWRLAAGEHTIQAVGLDGNGERVESSVVRFYVE